MDHELFEGFDGAACAAADLTARLLADLHQAASRLALAEARFRAAAATGAPIPFAVRHERTVCRRIVASLRQVLDGLPGGTEEQYVATA